MDEIGDKLAVVDRLRPFLTDDEMYGRMRVNLHDLIEAGAWLSAALERQGGESLTAKQAETFLIDLDVHFVHHVTWHLESMRKDIAAILARFADEDC